uniref:BTB domain-containing protein n=1 Tax=Timema genevievae TaxID=629358 RepID=A0A7R9K1Y6_TIMGE|nr:unnamed protein product [Timema genevievae]
MAMPSPSREKKDKGASSEDGDCQGDSLITSSRDVGSEHSLSSLTTQDESFHSAHHAEASLKLMESYLMRNQLTDVTLIADAAATNKVSIQVTVFDLETSGWFLTICLCTVGTRRIPAHRVVLSASSLYFAAMFTSDLREASQSEVELQNVDGEALWILVHYCYTGIVSFIMVCSIELREENVETLLGTACLLQLQEVVDACCNFLMKQLHPSNCIGIRLFADTQCCAHLLQVSHDYTTEHFTEVISNQEFLLLPADEVAKLLSSDDLNVPSEDHIFHALTAWVKHDVSERKKDCGQLLALVKLPLLAPSGRGSQLVATWSKAGVPNWWPHGLRQGFPTGGHMVSGRGSQLVATWSRVGVSNWWPHGLGQGSPTGGHMFIADYIETNPLFREERVCQDLIMEALKYHLLPERRPMLQSPRTRPRKSTVGALFAVGGMDANKGATSIEKFDLRTNSWSAVAKMSGRRLQFGVAVLDGKLYVVGGRDGLKTLNTVECYDMKTQVWTTLPAMSTHRHGLGVGVLEGPLYAVGGHDGWSYLNTVERWDPQARQWSFVAPMTTQRSTVGVAVLNSKLYAVGGRDGSSCLRTVECFDPHTNKWLPCAPMAKRRGGVGVGVVNGYLYALGGHDAPASNPSASRFDCVERYDPKTDTWTHVAPMSTGRDAIGVSLLGDRLFAVGGYDGQQYLKLVEAYDTQNNEWQQVGLVSLVTISLVDSVTVGIISLADIASHVGA